MAPQRPCRPAIDVAGRADEAGARSNAPHRRKDASLKDPESDVSSAHGVDQEDPEVGQGAGRPHRSAHRRHAVDPTLAPAPRVPEPTRSRSTRGRTRAAQAAGARRRAHDAQDGRAGRRGTSSAESAARYARGAGLAGTHGGKAVPREGPEHQRPELEEPQAREERIPGGNDHIPEKRSGASAGYSTDLLGSVDKQIVADHCPDRSIGIRSQVFIFGRIIRRRPISSEHFRS
jgi:hypothetical protein